MKAAVYHEYGGPEVLRVEEQPTPQIGPDEALVRVRAAGLNRLDLLMRAGLTPVKPLLPHIGGSEVAGELTQVGDNVRGFSPGQQVVVAPYLHDEDALGDSDLSRLTGDVLGLHVPGGHAEYVKVPGHALLAMPEELTFEEAAAQTFTALTAWRALVTKAGVRPGEVVLVLGAGSGTGVAAIQIAKLWGAQVIAASSRSEVLEKAKELGADEVINYTDQDFSKQVRKLTNKRGVDIIVEHIGMATFTRSYASLARYGKLIVCGTTSGGDASLSLSSLLSRELMIIGSYGGSKEELQEVLRLTAEGRLNATIDITFTLEDIRAAHERLESRQQFGKIVLKL